MALKIYNTLTRQKEIFRAIAGWPGFHVCLRPHGVR